MCSIRSKPRRGRKTCHYGRKEPPLTGKGDFWLEPDVRKRRSFGRILTGGTRTPAGQTHKQSAATELKDHLEEWTGKRKAVTGRRRLLGQRKGGHTVAELSTDGCIDAGRSAGCNDHMLTAINHIDYRHRRSLIGQTRLPQFITRLDIDGPDWQKSNLMERVKGIEPSSKAWEAFVLPLNHTREVLSK